MQTNSPPAQAAPKVPQFIQSSQQQPQNAHIPTETAADDVGSYNYQTERGQHDRHLSMTSRQDPSQRLIDTVNTISVAYQGEPATPLVDQLHKKPSNLSTSRHKQRKMKTKFPQH